MVCNINCCKSQIYSCISFFSLIELGKYFFGNQEQNEATETTFEGEEKKPETEPEEVKPQVCNCFLCDVVICLFVLFIIVDSAHDQLLYIFEAYVARLCLRFFTMNVCYLEHTVQHRVHAHQNLAENHLFAEGSWTPIYFNFIKRNSRY